MIEGTCTKKSERYGDVDEDHQEQSHALMHVHDQPTVAKCPPSKCRWLWPQHSRIYLHRYELYCSPPVWNGVERGCMSFSIFCFLMLIKEVAFTSFPHFTTPMASPIQAHYAYQTSNGVYDTLADLIASSGAGFLASCEYEKDFYWKTSWHGSTFRTRTDLNSVSTFSVRFNWSHLVPSTAQLVIFILVWRIRYAVI